MLARTPMTIYCKVIYEMMADRMISLKMAVSHKSSHDEHAAAS